jgi:hypothetical protein
MDKKWLYIIAVLVVLIIVIAAILAVMNSAQKCNYNDPNKSYIKKEANCIINFLCIQDRVAFSDACGCGCEVKTG